MDVGDGFREGPYMTSEVLHSILPFPVRVVGRGTYDARPEALGPLEVTVYVFHAHHDRVCQPFYWGRVNRSCFGCWMRAGAFDNNDGTVAECELGAVITDSDPLAKSEGIAQPRY